MTTETVTRTLSHEDYLKALGLGVLIRDQVIQIRALERTLAGLLDEPADPIAGDYFGVVSDSVYEQGGPDIPDLLKRLEIEVDPE